ncbi:MAG: protein kinase [Pyrinomonadaceae bacterium]
MEPERWKQIDAIFDALLDREPAERAAFLNSICGSDALLRREVEELLKAHNESQDFIETVAVEVAAKNFAAAQITHAVGRKIGTYEIDSLLGAGGMGEVYLAHDAKLNRRVALKLLPAHFAADAERLRRFKREAQAISALNHPNIVTIHDIGSTAEGEHFIATEFVEGHTLREIANSGKLSILEILKIFAQICEALEAAHKSGIVHRDIKPENVMIRPDGLVKVLDFGLAKRLTAASDNSHSQDFSATKNGFVIGTLNYLSPEQAVGDPLDPRTDLWSLGVCLFEVLTGKPPFMGASQQSVFNAILNSAAPAPTETNADLQPEFDLIVAKALEKDRELRYQTASDFRADLRRLNKLIDSAATWSNDKIKPGKAKTAAPSRFARWRAAAVIGAILILMSVAGFALWKNLKNNLPEAPNWAKATHTPLTDAPGTEYFPTLAPDGKTFVYAGKDVGNFDLYAQRISGKNAVNLTANSPADDTQPAFSPDGERIAFRSERAPAGIYLMEATGENVRRVCDFGYYPSWSPDGKEIVVAEYSQDIPSTRSPSALWVVNVASGAKRLLIENFAMQPAWSPNGRRIAFWFTGSGGRRDVATVAATGGAPVLVTNTANTNWNPVWSPDGRFLYFASDRSGNMAFWRVSIDETTGQVLSEQPEAVLTPAKFSRHLAFSHDGKRMIYVQTNIQANLQAAEFDPDTEKIVGEPVWITSGDREFGTAELSPDGKQFAIRLIRRTQEDLVLLNRDGSNQRDLTNDVAFDRYVRWSPDGKQIAFASDRSGNYEVWTIEPDGSNLRQITFDHQPGASFPVWSPDGKQLIYDNGDGKSFVVDLTREWSEQTRQVLPQPSEKTVFRIWNWSPDGKKLAGYFEGEENGVGFYSFETNRHERLSDAKRFAIWLADSRRILFAHNGKAFIVDTVTKKTRELLSRPPYDLRGVGISRDNKLLYYTLQTSESDIWMMSLE